MSFDVDLFVIGGGSGGVRAARIAAGEHGARVALAEADRLGGTCVIRGCVPKKLMVFAADLPHRVAEGQAYGWQQATTGPFDWPAFRARLDRELGRLEAAYRSGLTGAGVEVFDTRATVVDPHRVRLADGREVTAGHILIATGGRPDLPKVAREAGCWSSDDIFNLPELPKTMLIVGGGFIACEMACIMAGLGVRVTLLYRGPQVLRGFDNEARALVAASMVRQGIDIRTATDLTEIERLAEGWRVVLTDGRTETYGGVLCATGRRPNSQGLGLEALGVALEPTGGIAVDEWSQTTVPSIFAVGDVTGRIALTPVAIRDGHAFADTVFGARPRPVDHDLVASAVFTRPELGTVGLTEEEARARGPVEVYATTFRPMRTAFIGSEERVLMKLSVEPESRRVLGCQIVAPEAGELIQLAAVAIKMGATKEDFDRTVAVHPTMAEELVTMRRPVR